jgi:NAD(P)-dependent dehydrogenase (short-subunit alcohol dehydrogenase family)
MGSSPTLDDGLVTDRIAGRTALVTGGGNGLGRAIALALAAHTVRIAVVGRTIDALHGVTEEIVGQGGSATCVTCDVSRPESVAAAGALLADEDISILVNCAGVAGPVAPLTEVGPTEWDEVFATNVRGTYLVCKQFIPAMIRRGRGDVINVASATGKRPLAGRTPYAASKMAVIGLSATLAYEVAPLGVMVNSLSPGPVDGPRMARNYQLEAVRRGITTTRAEHEFVSRSPMGRMLTEQEVADTVVAMLQMSGLCAADIDLSAGMVAR